jgi:hypothetical protein
MRGDSLTVSSTTPGYAMRATDNSYTIGRAISDADESATGTKVLMIVENKQKALTLSGIEGVGAITSAASSTYVTTTVATTLIEKIARGGSIVTEYISVKVSAVVGYFDKLFAREIYTDKVCIKKSNGQDVCLTGDQVESIMNASQIPLMSPTTSNNQGGAGAAGGTGLPTDGTVLGTSTDSGVGGASTTTDPGATTTSTSTDQSSNTTPDPSPALDPTPTETSTTTP